MRLNKKNVCIRINIRNHIPFVKGWTIMSTEKKKVFVIDDQLEICELVDVTLHGTEFVVLKASGGKEGIQIAKEQKPDLISLDIMMPEVAR